MTFDEWMPPVFKTLTDDDEKSIAREAWDAAVAAEREECAKLAEEVAFSMKGWQVFHADQGHERMVCIYEARAAQATQLALKIRSRNGVET